MAFSLCRYQSHDATAQGRILFGEGHTSWMFAGSEGGAENAAILFSVIVSCKLHGVDPFAYLRDVLMRIQTHPASRVEELIPREWQKRFGAYSSPQTRFAA